MTDRRLTFIPRTALMCVLYLVIGAALLVGAVLDLTRHPDRIPPLTVVVIVAAGLLVIVSLIGLLVPRTRGR
ncbi:hypothetical protein [Amycolatopsis pithecellobii]|uniref:Uncharacterized protein n=1 Tax=Amycolatopsis pithecellobii TaxID=664692 RepID=A0A6N7Z2C3_9PSEU|nr:hypothetical protein [Amycolatopsis pithecellobii]MTD55773.1 hypothetical protein [Amycolatopsis pithecellobii]